MLDAIMRELEYEIIYTIDTFPNGSFVKTQKYVFRFRLNSLKADWCLLMYNQYLNDKKKRLINFWTGKSKTKSKKGSKSNETTSTYPYYAYTILLNILGKMCASKAQRVLASIYVTRNHS